jgi:hypothetical protein
MGELGFQWGGALGTVRDQSEMDFHPSVFGSAHLDVMDPAAFGQTLAQHGGEQAFVEAVKRSLVQTLSTVVASRVSRDSILGVTRDSAGLIADVESHENRMLQSTGINLRIMNLQVTLPEDETAALQKLVMDAAMVKRAAMMAEQAAAAPQAATASTAATEPQYQWHPSGAPAPFTPGTRVIATWSDGRQYPGLVRGCDGTNYELVWEGSTAVAWVPATAVRLG